jgi:hypothetical protein
MIETDKSFRKEKISRLIDLRKARVVKFLNSIDSRLDWRIYDVTASATLISGDLEIPNIFYLHNPELTSAWNNDQKSIFDISGNEIKNQYLFKLLNCHPKTLFNTINVIEDRREWILDIMNPNRTTTCDHQTTFTDIYKLKEVADLLEANIGTGITQAYLKE